MNPLADFFASNVNYTHGLASGPADGITAKSVTSRPQTKATPAQGPGHRVCDRCIVKKVKCDQKQPTCSRCLEAESPCVYSVKKRKPGPVKGSKHTKRRTSKDTSHRSSVSEASSPGSRRSSNAPPSQTNPWEYEQSIPRDVLQTGPTSISLPNAHVSSLFNQVVPSSEISSSIPSPLGIPPSVDQQRLLLDRFFVHIHPSIPLFNKQVFISRYDAGTLCPNLLLTICVVTAKILGMETSWNGSSLEDCTAYLLDLKVIENEGAGKPLSLDNFRQACVLSFYAFHQYPGDRSWMRIGNLTRKAYQCGLHRIDDYSGGSAFSREMIPFEELEEWRYVWWCIFCLDCYSNVTAVTPFVIEVESVKTALVTSSLVSSSDQPTASTELRYLPDDNDMLWKTVKEVTTSSGEINFNMHVLTTTLIHEVATVHRLRRQSTSKRLKAREADLEDQYSAFRLALPPRYLNGSRNAFTNESGAEHHARLICVLHIHLAKVLTYIPYDPQENEAEWTIRWQQCLESAEDIVSIVKQWDSQFFTATDPAICFIVQFALIMLHLHSCAQEVSLELKVRMDTHKDVLILFLEQFASTWSLARFLIISFEQFKKMVQGPVTSLETDRILKVAGGPLNYRWLNFLSLSADFENLDSPGRMYENLFSQEWDSNEWEALLTMSQI